jgi:hypothetical protein
VRRLIKPELRCGGGGGAHLAKNASTSGRVSYSRWKNGGSVERRSSGSDFMSGRPPDTAILPRAHRRRRHNSNSVRIANGQVRCAVGSAHLEKADTSLMILTR